MEKAIEAIDLQLPGHEPISFSINGGVTVINGNYRFLWQTLVVDGTRAHNGLILINGIPISKSESTSTCFLSIAIQCKNCCDLVAVLFSPDELVLTKKKDELISAVQKLKTRAKRQGLAPTEKMKNLFDCLETVYPCYVLIDEFAKTNANNLENINRIVNDPRFTFPIIMFSAKTDPCLNDGVILSEKSKRTIDKRPDSQTDVSFFTSFVESFKEIPISNFLSILFCSFLSFYSFACSSLGFIQKTPSNIPIPSAIISLIFLCFLALSLKKYNSLTEKHSSIMKEATYIEMAIVSLGVLASLLAVAISAEIITYFKTSELTLKFYLELIVCAAFQIELPIFVEFLRSKKQFQM